MKRLLCLFSYLLFFVAIAASQTIVTGQVVDRKGNPIQGVTVLSAKTFAGTITDTMGHFTMQVPPNDTLQLKCACMGYEPATILILPVALRMPINIVLKEDAVYLKGVVIAAGSFEASDEKKETVLKPFELATTPTASPDVFAAVQQLPGTTKVGESEGLFVRGGAASETKAIIDGTIVQEPFFSAVPGVAQKGRFSPLLFKGTAFSTGGYSVQYGGALSSVLVLNTQDLAQASSTTFNISTSGVSANSTQSWKNASFAVNGSYYNLGPSFIINKQDYHYEKAPEGAGSNIIFRLKGKNNGLFKIYGSWSSNSVNLTLPFTDSVSKQTGFSLEGRNVYINSSYKKTMGEWTFQAGGSLSTTKDNLIYITQPIQKENTSTEVRAVVSRKLNGGSKISVGTSWQGAYFSQTLPSAHYKLNESLLANFIEAEFYLGKRMAARAGVRHEYASYINRKNIAPRASLAYIIDRRSQVSFAFGDFYQQPSEVYLYTDKHLDFEKATHYILNYQYIHNNCTFRIELYYKTYNSLVKELDSASFNPFTYSRLPLGSFDNSGDGYARGIDVFWYDKKTFHNLDYWISYSYLDTKRSFANYPISAMPAFAANHNVSVIAKYAVAKTTLNLGMAYNFTSGRPYYYPGHVFLKDRTPSFHNLILNANYSWFKKNNLFAIYVYVDNILGIRNVYNYAFTSDGQRLAIGPPAYRSVFAGINITLAKHRSIMGISL